MFSYSKGLLIQGALVIQTNKSTQRGCVGHPEDVGRKQNACGRRDLREKNHVENDSDNKQANVKRRQCDFLKAEK